MFGSTDLSGLISSAFKDITKIPYNSQLFDYWISEISGDIVALPWLYFRDSKMILIFTDTLLPAGTVQLEIVEKMIDVTEPLWHYNSTTSDLPVQ